MTDLKKNITKATLGTVAAGAMALASFAVSATPAVANDRHHRDRGVDAGDVIAGAVIIGGIAALAGAFDGKRDRRHNDRRFRGNDRGFDNNYRGSNFRGRGGGQRAVERCIRVAERQARRFGGYRFADVTQIRDVEPTRYGWRVKGRMEVQGARGYRGRDFDRGRFTCFFERGNRPQVDFRGLQGL